MTRNEKLLRDHRERAECLGKSLSSVNQIVFAAERVNSCLERTVSSFTAFQSSYSCCFTCVSAPRRSLTIAQMRHLPELPRSGLTFNFLRSHTRTKQRPLLSPLT